MAGADRPPTKSVFARSLRAPNPLPEDPEGAPRLRSVRSGAGQTDVAHRCPRTSRRNLPPVRYTARARDGCGPHDLLLPGRAELAEGGVRGAPGRCIAPGHPA